MKLLAIIALLMSFQVMADPVELVSPAYTIPSVDIDMGRYRNNYGNGHNHIPVQPVCGWACLEAIRNRNKTEVCTTYAFPGGSETRCRLE